MDVHNESIEVFAFSDDDSSFVLEKRILNQDTSLKKTFKSLWREDRSLPAMKLDAWDLSYSEYCKT
jgi:hypothetical protein